MTSGPDPSAGILPEMVITETEPPRAPARREPAGRFGYQPALDGLRGVAVAAVLCFHADFAWARGGFLGVSTFFTLSGFLITTLLVQEYRSTGTIARWAFWSRRLRRLMPAALLTLGLVVVYATFAAPPEQLRDLRGDVGSALAYVANWRFVFADRSYADLFALPSAVQHFWSLAIEEQFYLFYPIIVFIALRPGRPGVDPRTRTKRVQVRLGGTLVALIAGSLLIGRIFAGNSTRVYYGTDTRAAELLVGALLAVAVMGTPRLRHRSAQAAASYAGLGALVLSAILWWRVPFGTSFLSRGGLAVYAIGTAVILLGALQPGPLQSVLSWRPLVLLGVISYGVYLLHWPIFLWLDPVRTGLDGFALFAVRIAVTLAAAIASYTLVEQPIRRRRLPPRIRLSWVMPAAVAAVVVSMVVVSANPPAPAFDLRASHDAAAPSARQRSAARARAQATLRSLAATTAPNDTRPPLIPNEAGKPSRLLILGNSVGLTLAAGFDAWAPAHGMAIDNRAEPGCGITRGGSGRYGNFGAGPTLPYCDDWPSRFAYLLDRDLPQTVMVLFGSWEVIDRQMPGSTQWTSIGQPVYDQWLREELEAATRLLVSRGSRVVWLTSPYVDVGRTIPGHPLTPESRPGRMDRYNQILREVVAEFPGQATLVDLQAQLGALPGGQLDPVARPDGIHFTKSAATDVVRDWLGPTVAAISREDRAQFSEPPTIVHATR